MKAKIVDGKLHLEFTTAIIIPVIFETVSKEIAGINLTAREKQVLDETLKGKTNKEIGNTISVSERTVKYHRRSLFSKFGVKNCVELQQLMIRARGE